MELLLEILFGENYQNQILCQQSVDSQSSYSHSYVVTKRNFGSKYFTSRYSRMSHFFPNWTHKWDLFKEILRNNLHLIVHQLTRKICHFSFTSLFLIGAWSSAFNSHSQPWNGTFLMNKMSHMLDKCFLKPNFVQNLNI